MFQVNIQTMVTAIERALTHYYSENKFEKEKNKDLLKKFYLQMKELDHLFFSETTTNKEIKKEEDNGQVRQAGQPVESGRTESNSGGDNAVGATERRDENIRPEKQPETGKKRSWLFD